MINKILESFKNFEKITCEILKGGLEFCVFLCIISVSILLTYNTIVQSPSLYYIGISLFRLSLIFAIEFIICSFVTDEIKKGLI